MSSYRAQGPGGHTVPASVWDAVSGDGGLAPRGRPHTSRRGAQHPAPQTKQTGARKGQRSRTMPVQSQSLFLTEKHPSPSPPSAFQSIKASPLSPERPPFLAGRADTASPGQGLPSLTEPTRQVPGLAPPTLWTCWQEDSRRWEGCGPGPWWPGWAKSLPGSRKTGTPAAGSRTLSVGKRAGGLPGRANNPHPTPGISAPARQPGVATGHLV